MSERSFRSAEVLNCRCPSLLRVGVVAGAASELLLLRLTRLVPSVPACLHRRPFAGPADSKCHAGRIGTGRVRPAPLILDLRLAGESPRLHSRNFNILPLESWMSNSGTSGDVFGAEGLRYLGGTRDLVGIRDEENRKSRPEGAVHIQREAYDPRWERSCPRPRMLQHVLVERAPKQIHTASVMCIGECQTSSGRYTRQKHSSGCGKGSRRPSAEYHVSRILGYPRFRNVTVMTRA